MKQPHGIFDNRRAMRRERWFNGELRFYVEAHAQHGRTSLRDFTGLFGRPEEQQPWGSFPDLDMPADIYEQQVEIVRLRSTASTAKAIRVSGDTHVPMPEWCEKCWNTPCDCGHAYRDWTPEQRRKLAAAVLGEIPLKAELPTVSERKLQELIEYFYERRQREPPWFQDIESALRELQKLRSELSGWTETSEDFDGQLRLGNLIERPARDSDWHSITFLPGGGIRHLITGKDGCEKINGLPFWVGTEIEIGTTMRKLAELGIESKIGDLISLQADIGPPINGQIPTVTCVINGHRVATAEISAEGVSWKRI